MALKYGKKKQRQNILLYTVATALVLCIVFISVINYFYNDAEEAAYEELHVQTKQIKDDLTLQLTSDRENLLTMANFAAKLYADGESYSLMFDSFKPIGLIANIGILNPDNTFVTKEGEIDLSGKISFADEAAKGAYISGRTADLTNENVELVRSAVPITAGGRTVGILYGVIRLEGLDNRYAEMANNLSAQLFVFDKETGNFVIDTVRDSLGNVSELKNRKYNDNFTYEAMMHSESGYSSFVSAYTGKDLYVHYSALPEFGWTILVARPEALVFDHVYVIANVLFVAFAIMVLVISLYLLVVMRDEKNKSASTACASKIRKLLLEVNQQKNNLSASLKEIAEFSHARSAIFFDTNGEDYYYISPGMENCLLTGEERKYFVGEILRYAAEYHRINKSALSLMSIKPNNHLLKTNEKFYNFLKEHDLREVTFASVIDKNNHISILGILNPKKGRSTRGLLVDIAVCFSIAIYNKRHLSNTEIAATTDSLTGVSNRVAYKKELLIFDEKKPHEFSCVYIDVNELHLRNNKYGHAAGDEMLLYIANTLKEVFYGHKIYRMGGDEFLVFAEDTPQDDIKKGIEHLIKQLEIMDYHVAIGMSYRTQNTNTEEMVREAEIRMYEAKAQYYQSKEQKSVSKADDSGYVQTKTGIAEIDTMISVMKEHYNGIYRVSLDTDKAHRILMPAYLGYSENEEHFSKLLTKYIDEMIDPDFHRAAMAFLNYDALKRQLSEGKIPKITYKKTNSETTVLSIYKLSNSGDNTGDTLWVFAKE